MAYSAGPDLLKSISSNRIQIDVDKVISELNSDASEFTTILMKARKSTTDSYKFTWWENEPESGWTQVNNTGGYLDDATGIVVDDETQFAAKDLIKCPRTGEVMYVEGVDASTHKVKVTRAFGGSAAALNDNDYLVRLGNAMEENSQAPASKLKQPIEKYNYIQTVRTPFDASLIAGNQALQAGPDERIRLRKEKLFDHKLDIGRIALWGVAKNDTTNNITATNGIFSYITTNATNINGPLTEAAFNNFLRTVFQNGNSSSRILVTSHYVAGIINQFAAGKIETRSGEDTYGLRLRMYRSYFGDVYIMTDKSFRNYYSNYALLVDPKNIEYKVFAGYDTKLHQNIQENDRLGWKDEYVTIFGMKVKQEKTHGFMYGITG